MSEQAYERPVLGDVYLRQEKRIAQLEAELKEAERNKYNAWTVAQAGELANERLQADNAELREDNLKLVNSLELEGARLEMLARGLREAIDALKSIAANTDDDNARDLCLRTLRIDNPQP